MSNVQRYSSLDDMIELARYAHRNQKDKAGLPYFEHPYRVMQTVQAQGALPYVQIGAILHDISEDTAFSTAVLKQLGVPEPALEIVRLMDRGASKQTFYDHRGIRDTYAPDGMNPNPEQYKKHNDVLLGCEHSDDYYYAAIARNPGALMVKRADITDNTQEWRLSYLPDATQDRLRGKYQSALRSLEFYSTKGI